MSPADDAIAALRALLDGEWAEQYRIGRLTAAALDIPAARVRLEISRSQIALVIRADVPGGEAWDDYAAAREQPPIVSPPAVRELANRFTPRCTDES